MASFSKLPLSSGPRSAAVTWDLLSSLTGGALAVYIVAHMALVGSVLLGVGVYDTMAEALESSGVAQIDGPLVFTVFLVHFLAAGRKVPLRWTEHTLVWRQSRMLRHSETWLWLGQALTGMILLLLGVIHMWSVLTDLPITAAKSSERIAHPAWFVFYVLLICAVTGHAFVGLYRSGIKWGAVVRRKRAAARRFFLGGAGVLGLLGLITLVRFLYV